MGMSLLPVDPDECGGERAVADHLKPAEHQKRAEGSEAREARGRLITLDISLPHRGITGMTGSAGGRQGVLAYGPESTHPGTFRDQQSAIDDERWQRFLRVEPKR